MSVYHCPLCPLIFQYRTEVEWHLREEHRSRSDEAADLRAELAAATEPLNRERLAELRSSDAEPSVTLLLSTAPAATMTVLDIARLRQLADRARRRLSAQPDPDAVNGVVGDRLSRAVSFAESRSTDRGVTILVNQHDVAVITLPFGPRDRLVVGRHFATRDLDYALRRYPRYRVLVLGHHPRILEGHASNFSEPAASPGMGAPRTLNPGRTTTNPDSDKLLEEQIEARGALPLVVVGDQRELERFHRSSRYAGHIFAEVRRPRFHRTEVPALVSEELERIHRTQQSRSVAELLHSDMQSRIAWGLQAAWEAVQSQTADRLWVEHDYLAAGRVLDGAYGIAEADDLGEPEPADDLIDTLLTKAARLGMTVDVLDRHILGRVEPVAVKIPVPAPTHTLGPRPLAATT